MKKLFTAVLVAGIIFIGGYGVYGEPPFLVIGRTYTEIEQFVEGSSQFKGSSCILDALIFRSERTGNRTLYFYGSYKESHRKLLGREAKLYYGPSFQQDHAPFEQTFILREEDGVKKFLTVFILVPREKNLVYKLEREGFIIFITPSSITTLSIIASLLLI